MVEVEILGQAITHQYGTLNTGDILRTSAEFAKHLVEDCGAAKYRSVAPAAQEQGAGAPVPDAPGVVAGSTQQVPPAAEPKAKPGKAK